MTVLVYAHDAGVRAQLIQRLERPSREVVGAANEAAAEAEWKRTCLTAIVLGPDAGEDDGLHRRLSSAFGLHRPAVLAIRPRAGADEVRATLEAGVDDVITTDDERELDARLTVLEARAVARVPGALLSAIAEGLAHEIRNPLNGACLHLEVADRALAAGDPALARSGLAAMLLDLARIERLAEAFVSYADARSSRVCADVVATTRRAIEQTRLERSTANLWASLPNAPLYVLHDVDRIATAIQHLVGNALSAAGAEGEVTATLRAESRDVQIVVEDTGPGPGADVDVFAPFSTTKPSSLGLGLPTAQRIAAEHGGYVWLTRTSGRTAAGLVLPLVECRRS